jgi:hypothetical protein
MAVADESRRFSFEVIFDERRGNLPRRASWYGEEVSDGVSEK